MEIVWLIVFGSLIMLVLAISVISFVVLYQKKVISNKHKLQVVENAFQLQLIEATLLSEQNEREKIAKNLHDDLGSSLTALRFNFEKLLTSGNRPDSDRKNLESSLQTISQTITDLRRISRDLMPETLLRFGYVQALKDFCNSFNNLNIAFNISVEEPFSEISIQVQLYYISKEIINNIVKHSGSNGIEILIMNNNATITLVFKYKGKGISNSDVTELYNQNKGLGLKSIESRLRMISGKIDYIKNGDINSSVHIYLSRQSKN